MSKLYAGNGVVCVDFDGTLFPYRPLYEQNPPMPNAVETMWWLKAQGYKIVIFTSRLSPSWLEESGESEQRSLGWVEGLLVQNNIPYDMITAEKVPAEYYIDDRAIAFRGNWLQVKKEVMDGKVEN
jgi:hypothetical protein